MKNSININKTPMRECIWCEKLTLIPFEIVDHQDELVYSFCNWGHMMEWVKGSLKNGNY
jgi:hypothetical protein